MAHETPQGIGQQASADDPHVLEHDVHRVLGLREAALQHGKSQVHQEYEGGGNDRPQHAGDKEIECVGMFGL